jgi:hypothetical protein
MGVPVKVYEENYINEFSNSQLQKLGRQLHLKFRFRLISIEIILGVRL